MRFPTTYILAFVLLLVAPALSIPINVPKDPDMVTGYPVHAGLEKRSLGSWSQPYYPPSLHAYLKRDLQGYDSLVPRGTSSVLEARSFDAGVDQVLAKRTEGQSTRLVRRKNILQKIGDGIKNGGFISP